MKSKVNHSASISVALAAFASWLSCAQASAETVQAAPVTVSASVDGELSLEVKMFRGFEDPTNEVKPATTMDFGELKDLGSHTLRSDWTNQHILWITANSHRHPFTVTQNATPLILDGGTTEIPHDAYFFSMACMNFYDSCQGGSVFNRGSVVGTKVLYTSGGAHRAVVLRGHYLITDEEGGWVTLDFPAGTYRGTLTISITA